MPEVFSRWGRQSLAAKASREAARKKLSRRQALLALMPGSDAPRRWRARKPLASRVDCNKSPSSWNLAMSIFVDRGKLESPEKISSEQGREPTTLKRKALMTLGPGFDPSHIGARQALSQLRHHNLRHDHSQNTRLVIRA